SARAERRQLLRRVRFALRRCTRRCSRARWSDGAAADHRDCACSALRALWRYRNAQPSSVGHCRGGDRLVDSRCRQDGGPFVSQALELGTADCNHGFHRCCDPAMAAAVGICRPCPRQRCACVDETMNDSPLFSLFGYFALLSLFAVGGANAAIPEMHRIAVEVMQWMTDRQFADSFAIAQVSPGPNIIIVTLIGYHVAGLAGA